MSSMVQGLRMEVNLNKLLQKSRCDVLAALSGGVGFID